MIIVRLYRLYFMLLSSFEVNMCVYADSQAKMQTDQQPPQNEG